MKSARSPPPSTRPLARSKKASSPFRPASASSKPCSTPCRMPSSQSAPTAACSGPTAAWSDWSPSGPRLNAPVVETVRDPAIPRRRARRPPKAKQIVSARAIFDRPRPHLRCHRRSSARRRRGRRAARSHRNRARRKNPPRFHRQCFPRIAHSAHLDPGIHRNPARQLPPTTATSASSWKSFARMPPACRASPKICLTLARVESGETRFDAEPASPAELLNDAVESFREIARAQGMELKSLRTVGRTRPCMPIAKPSIRSSPTSSRTR